jgi:HxlR-like helix-turn-helix
MKPDGSDFDRLLLDQIADRWSILVLGSICAAGGALRFNELRRQVSGVAQKTLTQCLRRLERPPPFPAARPEAVPRMVEIMRRVTPLPGNSSLAAHRDDLDARPPRLGG